MWTILLTLCISRTSWIFLFIVLYITVFIIITSNDDGKKLKERILHEGKYIAVMTMNESRNNTDTRLEMVTGRLMDKKLMLKRSQYEVNCEKKVLNDIENKTWTCRSRYKSLMKNLKMDVKRTEQKIEFLENQVSKLFHRREELKKEVAKQQEEYEKILNHFTNDLKSKGKGYGTSIQTTLD